ncbi:MgtC/SapB family protein [Sphingobium baderi]|uniref:MgtC/SapB family protein n=1 Tax=Sphingobium baderi TaxID=1332080 RepID=UPI002B414153|nr:hypothetical protein [Sphingobium baderi]WRD78872.1 hypothetical protein QQ987_19595 [Sphingobium baderi]
MSIDRSSSGGSGNALGRSSIMTSLSPLHFVWFDILARSGAAALFSLMIGLERFLNRRSVDFRPFFIVSKASCSLVIGLIEGSFAITDPSLFH